MEKYLLEAVNEIEKKNNKMFSDPFYEIEGMLLALCEKYLDHMKIKNDYKAFHMFIDELEKVQRVFHKIDIGYTRNSDELSKRRTDGFLSKLFEVLADNAEQMSSLVNEIILTMHDTEGDMSVSDFKEVESLYMELAVHVSKTSQSIDSYYIDNLWQ